MKRNKKGIILLSLILILSSGFNSCKILRPSDMFNIEEDYPLSEFEPSKKEYEIKPIGEVEAVNKLLYFCFNC